MQPPNMRVQRTRSSPSALRSPLTRHPLGGGRLLCCVTLLCAIACSDSHPRELVKVIVVNQSNQLLDSVELSPTTIGGQQLGTRRLGRLLPGGSIECSIESDEPQRVDLQIWLNHCSGGSSSPVLVPGAAYTVVVTAESTPMSLVTDHECHQHFKIRGSVRRIAAA